MTPDGLRRALATLGWTFREAARYLHVSGQTVHNWTTGKTRMPYAADLMITRALREHEEVNGNVST